MTSPADASSAAAEVDDAGRLPDSSKTAEVEDAAKSSDLLRDVDDTGKLPDARIAAEADYAGKSPDSLPDVDGSGPHDISVCWDPCGIATDVEQGKPRYEIFLGGAWTDVDEEEQKQLQDGFDGGHPVFRVVRKGTTYEVNVATMEQVNVATGRPRKLRKKGSTAEALGKLEWEDIDPANLLSEVDRGPSLCAFDAEQPIWRWLNAKGMWNDFTPTEGAQMEAYYRGFLADPSRYGADMILQDHRSVVFNFKLMLQNIRGEYTRIRRCAQVDDVLTNEFFYKAFLRLLLSSGLQDTAGGKEAFDFTRNQDYRGKFDDGRRMKRGGFPYRLPFGWKRFAVKVDGKYDDGSNTWLSDGEGGWAVAYHGTQKQSLAAILKTGFSVGPRQLYKDEVGKGVYCTWDMLTAAFFATPQELDGHSVQIVLQVRVRPEAIKWVTTGPRATRNYWVVNDPKDLRAYGVLMRETPKDAEWDKTRPNTNPCCSLL